MQRDFPRRMDQWLYTTRHERQTNYPEGLPILISRLSNNTRVPERKRQPVVILVIHIKRR
jgi:hypothetical protein